MNYHYVGLEEATTVAEARPQPTGTLHRFYSDEAIQTYCENNDLYDAVVFADGRVMAAHLYIHQDILIGWVG